MEKEINRMKLETGNWRRNLFYIPNFKFPVSAFLECLYFMPVRVHLKISGRVQGVCFRYYCRAQAEQLGLKGLVRNNADGSVEVMAEGEDGSIKSFIAWCRRGPPSAMVRTCEENYEAATGEFDSFTIGF